MEPAQRRGEDPVRRTGVPRRRTGVDGRRTGDGSSTLGGAEYTIGWMNSEDEQITAALVSAYRAGAFPMADPETGRIDWFSPSRRALMPVCFAPDQKGRAFHVSRSLAARIRSRRFHVTADETFEGVIRSCGERRPERPETWIDERIVHAYSAMFRAGHAHSVEAWLAPGPGDRTPDGSPSPSRIFSPTGDRVLVGGVYGVRIGSAFFAESMFCRPEFGSAAGADGRAASLPGTDASKVCLFHLVSHLAQRGCRVMDVQFNNPHIAKFGVYTVARASYLKLLAQACEAPMAWAPFDPAHHVGVLDDAGAARQGTIHS